MTDTPDTATSSGRLPSVEDAPVLTVDQVAEVLGLHPQTVRKQIAEGVIPSIRYGRAIRVPNAPFRADFEVPS